MKKHLCIGFVLLFVFIIFTGLVCSVDLKPIGRQESEVGFASLNADFHALCGEHEGLYKVTEILGLAAVPAIAVFGVLGLVQWIKRKSIIKVDRDILLLGGLYAVLLLCYILFEKVIINFRPPFGTEDALEASYPSSHSLLLLAVMTTTVMQIVKRVENKGIRGLLAGLCIAIGLVVICGRAVCGVHWLTDIIGGVLLAAALCFIYYALAFSESRREDPPFNCVYYGPEMMDGRNRE